MSESREGHREARYRPGAPSDGCGSVELTAEELRDPERLELEARQYAVRFITEEDTRQFNIGVSKYPNRPLVFIVEAARVFCGAVNDDLALRLLEMAIEEIKAGRNIRPPPFKNARQGPKKGPTLVP